MLGHKNFALINIDSACKIDAEITGKTIDAYICSMSFKNFDDIKKRFPFLFECCTYNKSNWLKLIPCADTRVWIKNLQTGVLIFDANEECGYVRTYRFLANNEANIKPNESWVSVKNEAVLYDMLNTPTANAVFSSWIEHKNRVTEMSAVMCGGRLQNTSVERALIFSKEDGCVVCGDRAKAYAATTFGWTTNAVLVQLPVCDEHLAFAKEYPSILSFIASLLHQSLDLPDLIKSESIPDDLIPILHSKVAKELGAIVGKSVKRRRGWELWLDLPSGWKWLLRLNSFTDYAYMLFERDNKAERYRADSAKDHPDLPFFPIHQHSRPKHKKDEITPSFLYGYPLLDLKRLKEVGREQGAYKE